MALITKKDRDTFYARAMQLTADAANLDTWADQLRVEGFGDFADQHREIAITMREAAATARRWADGYQDE